MPRFADDDSDDMPCLVKSNSRSEGPDSEETETEDNDTDGAEERRNATHSLSDNEAITGLPQQQVPWAP